MSNKRNKKKTRPLKNWPLAKCVRFVERMAEGANMNPKGFRRYPQPAKFNKNRLANGRAKKKLFTDRVFDKIAAEEKRI